MIRPKIFLCTTFVLLVLILAQVFGFVNLFKAIKQAHRKKNVAVVFIDISKSDTLRTWLSEDNTRYFRAVVNNVLRSGNDALAVYFLHGRTIDAAPFWTNNPLSGEGNVEYPEESSSSIARLWREECLQKFDSIISLSYTSHFNSTDSIQLQFTDILGAVEQACLNYRFSANLGAGSKQLYFISDMCENAGRISATVKTEGMSTIAIAESKAANAAKSFISAATDAGQLEGANIFIKSPSDKLFISNDRNSRRVFWETFFIKYLKAGSVNYQ